MSSSCRPFRTSKNDPETCLGRFPSVPSTSASTKTNPRPETTPESEFTSNKHSLSAQSGLIVQTPQNNSEVPVLEKRSPQPIDNPFEHCIFTIHTLGSKYCFASASGGANAGMRISSVQLIQRESSTEAWLEQSWASLYVVITAPKGGILSQIQSAQILASTYGPSLIHGHERYAGVWRFEFQYLLPEHIYLTDCDSCATRFQLPDHIRPEPISLDWNRSLRCPNLNLLNDMIYLYRSRHRRGTSHLMVWVSQILRQIEFSTNTRGTGQAYNEALKQAQNEVQTFLQDDIKFTAPLLLSALRADEGLYLKQLAAVSRCGGVIRRVSTDCTDVPENQYRSEKFFFVEAEDYLIFNFEPPGSAELISWRDLRRLPLSAWGILLDSRTVVLLYQNCTPLYDRDDDSYTIFEDDSTEYEVRTINSR